MAASTSRIIQLYKSRTTILELLEKQGFNIEDYQGFSINEIDAMSVNTQLDMLLSHKTDGRKVYVKYYASKQIRPANLEEIIEDLYVIDVILTKTDTLIIIIDDEPNDTILDKIKYLYDRRGVFIIIFNIKRLQFNILNHVLVPNATVLSEPEKDELMIRLQVKSLDQLPEISRFDPQAMAIGMRPSQICRFNRDSLTALSCDYYRVCV
jgi:DNA-directed RNA polymerase subunit H (RpoH/RPB5)